MSDADRSMPNDVMPHALDEHAIPVILISICIYAVLAGGLLYRARWRWRRIREKAGAPVVAQSSAGPAAEIHQAAPVAVVVQSESNEAQ